MKSLRNKIMAVLVVFTMVLTLCPANFAAAAANTTLKTKSITLEVGKSSTIALNNKKSTSTYSFASSDKAVATVTKAGKVTAVKAGSATITVKEAYKANGAKKSRKVGSVKVTVKGGAATTTPVKAANSYNVDLSTVMGGTYDAGSGTATVSNSTCDFLLNTPLKNGDVITVTVKGTYNGSAGFRSWVIDDSQTTMSDIAGTDVFPAKKGDFTATYTLTVTGSATRLFFKGPAWDNPNVDNCTFNSITISQK